MRKTNNSDENILGMLAHLLGLFISFIGPLVIYRIVKDRKKSLAKENAKHSLNFQISLIIYSIIVIILIILLIGIPLIIALGIFELVTIIIGSIKAYNGEEYAYPLEIRFFK